MTPDQEKKYLKAGGNICPFCQSNDIEGGRVDIDSQYAYQDVNCVVCGKEWTDLYELTGVHQEDI